MPSTMRKKQELMFAILKQIAIRKPTFRQKGVRFYPHGFGFCAHRTPNYLPGPGRIYSLASRSAASGFDRLTPIEGHSPPERGRALFRTAEGATRGILKIRKNPSDRSNFDNLTPLFPISVSGSERRPDPKGSFRPGYSTSSRRSEGQRALIVGSRPGTGKDRADAEHCARDHRQSTELFDSCCDDERTEEVTDMPGSVKEQVSRPHRRAGGGQVQGRELGHERQDWSSMARRADCGIDHATGACYNTVVRVGKSC